MADTSLAFPNLHDLDFMEGKQVLVVDDEPDIVSSVSRLLSKALPGITVQTAADGEEAIELIGEQEFDAILTDYRMPGAGGIEVLATAMVEQPMTPRVLFSAFADLDLALQAINELKVESVLTKPLDSAALVHLVNDVLVERHMQE